jgi:hypothetical protein
MKKTKQPKKSLEQIKEEIIAYGYIYCDLKRQERAALAAGDIATVKQISALIVEVQVEQRILNEQRLKMIGKYPKREKVVA